MDWRCIIVKFDIGQDRGQKRLTALIQGIFERLVTLSRRGLYHDLGRRKEVTMYTDDLKVMSTMALALTVIIAFCALL